MLNFDFFELLVIGVVALVVVGPERLPAVARAAGRLMGRFQRFMNTMAADLNTELEIDELKRLHKEAQLKLEQVNKEAREGMQKAQETAAIVESEVNAIGHHVAKDVESVKDQTAEAVTQAVNAVDDAKKEVIVSEEKTLKNEAKEQ